MMYPNISNNKNNKNKNIKPVIILTSRLDDASTSMIEKGKAPILALQESFVQNDNWVLEGINVFIMYDTFATKARKGVAKWWKNVTDDEKQIMIDNLIPDGCTRLYDTAIESIDRHIKKHEEFYNLIKGIGDYRMESIWQVFTDGMDNQSNDNSLEIMRLKIEKLRKMNVRTIFIGAGINAMKEGSSMGFARRNIVQTSNTEDDCKNAYRSVSTSLHRAITTGKKMNITVPQCSTSVAFPSFSATSQVSMPKLSRSKTFVVNKD